MLKGLGYFLIIIGLLWFLYCLGSDFLAYRTGTKELGEAIQHTLLMGLLLFFVLSGIGSALLAVHLKRNQERSLFEAEQQIVLLINKEGRIRFDTLLDQVSINKQQLYDLLTDMGKRRLITGVLNWRDRVFMSSESMDRQPSHGECPVCGSLTTPENPLTAVCTRCNAYIFLPESPLKKQI